MGLEWIYNRTPTHGAGAMVGTWITHHFWFFVQNNEVQVQYKIYCKDLWGVEGGYSVLCSVPRARAKPGLALIMVAEPCKVEAFDEFIALKECHISRCQHVLENMEAILETHKLKSYIRDFPVSDCVLSRHYFHFGPTTYNRHLTKTRLLKSLVLIWNVDMRQSIHRNEYSLWINMDIVVQL